MQVVRAEQLRVGDILIHAFGKTSTVSQMEIVGPRTQYVKLRTEHGPTRMEVGHEVMIQDRA